MSNKEIEKIYDPQKVEDELYSKWMEKDYLVNGYLKGRDILETRIPQNYGFNQLEEIVNL